MSADDKPKSILLDEIEAGVAQLLNEMEGDPGDSHEIYLRLRQQLDTMRAEGLPIPEDLAKLEADLAERFEGDATG